MAEPITGAPVDTPPTAPEAPATPQVTPADAGYFLEVNDRQRYRTADDARKAFSEAGQRIAELSPWEKVAQQFGEEGKPLSPDDVAYHLGQYAEQLRKTAATQPSEAKPTQHTPEQEQWIKEVEALGFTRKEAVSKLEEQLTQLQQQVSSYQDASAAAGEQALLAEGRNYLSTIMSKEGLELPQDTFMSVAGWIGQWAENQSRDAQGNIRPGSLEDKFWNGTDADRKAVVDAGYAYFKSVQEGLAAKKNAAVVAQKSTAQSNVPKPLPPGSVAPPPPAGKKAHALDSEETWDRTYAILQRE